MYQSSIVSQTLDFFSLNGYDFYFDHMTDENREYLTIILRNRADRVILSRRGRRPSRLKSDDIPRV